MAHEAFLANQFAGAHYPEPHHSVGLGIQYHGYEHAAQGYYQPDGRQSHTGSPYMQSAIALSSPPTPLSSHSDTGRRTRNGRSQVRNDSPQSNPHRSSPPRSTRKKKTGASKNDKHKTPKLTAPLSVLTKDMTNVPVRDMEAWVNRSVEDRLKEAERRNGYIARPMNSFMLYRSAYAERTKMWCLHNNHQVVSSVSGESWPLEPPEVREFYNELAKIERINHQNAHPNYKFSPSKPGVQGANKKRKGGDSDDDSDVDDPEWGAANNVRSRPAKRPGRDAGYPARANLGDAQHTFRDPYNSPAWDNTVRPPPSALMGHPQMYQPQYFQSPTMHHQHLQMMPAPVDAFNQIDATGFSANQSLIGLPGGSHAELLGLHSGAPTPMMEPQVDPMLLAFDDVHHSTGFTLEGGLTLTQHAEYETNFNPEYTKHREMAVPYNAAEAGGPLVTDYQPKEWQPDSSSPSFEQPSEFEKLWDDAQHGHHIERRSSAKSAKYDDKAEDGEEKPKSPRSA